METESAMKITKNVLEAITAHAEKGAPIEACGYLAQEGSIITRHYELANMDRSPEHFSFDPKEQFAVFRDARSKGLEICAVYHSHPATPARPSVEDIKLAFDPDLSYVIVSLAGGKADIRSFKIKNTKAEQEVLEAIDGDML
jgi:proteasome lid subunit RPN8/RPN11